MDTIKNIYYGYASYKILQESEDSMETFLNTTINNDPKLLEKLLDNGIYSLFEKSGFLHTISKYVRICCFGGISSLIVGFGEFGYLTIAYRNSKLSWTEYRRQMIITGITSCSSGISSYMATMLSGSYGIDVSTNKLLNKTPFARPIGKVTSVLSAVLIGVVPNFGLNYLFDRYWSAQYKNRNEICIKEALKHFLIADENDNIIKIINDETKFNRQIIESRYRGLAKMCHPDRFGGSKKKFDKLGVNLTLLLCLLEYKQDKENVNNLNNLEFVEELIKIH